MNFGIDFFSVEKILPMIAKSFNSTFNFLHYFLAYQTKKYLKKTPRTPLAEGKSLLQI